MDTGAPWRALEAPAREPQEPTAPGRGRSIALVVVAGAAVLLLGSIGLVAYVELGRGGGVDVVPATFSSSSPLSSGPTIVVQVAGAVAHPGVYSLPPGSRTADAIEAAGGYAVDVDPVLAETRLNLAARLTDGQSILVPRLGASTGSDPAPASGGPLNLNSATAEQLDSLPGIGPATAAKIIASREEKPFASVDDLVTRKLVTDAVLAKFRDQVTV